MKIHLGSSHLTGKGGSTHVTVVTFTEGATDDGRYSIKLFDAAQRKIHEAKGDTRWHALFGLLKWGFDIEWEAGETPEAEPRRAVR